MMPDSSTAYRRVYWKSPSHRQVKLFGIIRYTDDPRNVQFYVPRLYEQSDRSCAKHGYMPHTKDPAVMCTTTFKLPTGREETLVSYHPESNRDEFW